LDLPLTDRISGKATAGPWNELLIYPEGYAAVKWQVLGSHRLSLRHGTWSASE